MPYPHKLPTFWKMVRVIAIYVVAYALLVWFADLSLKDVSAEVRLKLGKIGVVTVYVAGLLAGLGFFWSSKARENAHVSSQRIATLTFQQSLLTDLQTEQGHQFQDRIEQLGAELKQEQEIEAAAQAFPNTLERLGFVSIIFLAAGTILQLLSMA